MAKVDIVVPCYNYGRFLEDCVGSVLDQSIRDVRVLIIDDASSDDSLLTAGKLADADQRVSVIAHARNQGHIRTYNEGIDWADSDYFLLLSADDMLVQGTLARATAIMDENPDIGLTYGESAVWQDGLPFPSIRPTDRYNWSRQDIIKQMCHSAINFVPTPTAVARTSSQKAIGGYRPSLPHAGDMEMWLRFAGHGAVARIHAVQAIYRKHTSAMSNDYFSAIYPDVRQRRLAFESFFAEYGSSLTNSRELQSQASRALAQQAVRSGVALLRRGQLSTGLRLVREAMSLDRRLRYSPPLLDLLKFPGPEGREWASSVVRGAADRLFGRAGSSSEPWQ
jgi:glycosyltransferase involved in cell wall biosynthesis